MADDISNEMRRFRPYPAYKDSGVEWLGKVPEHWEVKRQKFAALIEAGQSPPSEFVTDGSVGLPFLQGNADFGTLNPTPRQVCDLAPKRAKSGDLLLSVRAPVGAMNIADQPYGIGRGLCAITPTIEVDSRFFFHTLTTTRCLLNAVATGSTYDAVTTSQVGDLPALLPRIPEQHAIATFLDRETTRIDELVAKKEQLIELLQEKRAALITHEVTKGLDPNVPMKDSGVEWLGKIPANWETNRLKHLIRVPLKYGANEAAESRDMTWPRFVRITDITESGDLREDTFCSLPPDVASAYILDDGDVLFARSGATVGKSFLYRSSWGQCCYAGYLIRARIDRTKMTDEFFRYFSSSRAYWDQIYSSLIQATIQNMSAEKYANLWLRVPPLEEQRGIVSFLDWETARMDALITKVKEAIVRIKEYRTTLISAAVTGKIDVRKEVSH